MAVVIWFSIRLNWSNNVFQNILRQRWIQEIISCNPIYYCFFFVLIFMAQWKLQSIIISVNLSSKMRKKKTIIVSQHFQTYMPENLFDILQYSKLMVLESCTSVHTIGVSPASIQRSNWQANHGLLTDVYTFTYEWFFDWHERVSDGLGLHTIEEGCLRVLRYSSVVRRRVHSIDTHSTEIEKWRYMGAVQCLWILTAD